MLWNANKTKGKKRMSSMYNDFDDDDDHQKSASRKRAQ
jgi:hypothetical protein